MPEEMHFIRIIDKIKERGIFPSPRFDDVFRKVYALRTYFVTEKNKMEQSKTSGAGSRGICKRGGSFMSLVVFS